MRDEGKIIFNDLSSRKFNCLQALVRYVAASSGIFNVAIIRSHCIRLLRYLLVNEHHLTTNNSILDIDAFSLLVSLILSSPSLYVRETEDDPGCALTLPLGSEFDQHSVNMVILLHLVQVILTCQADADEPMDVDEEWTMLELEPSSEATFVVTFANEILTAAGLPPIINVKLPKAEQLLANLKTKMLPFLRCTAMLFHFLTCVPPPVKMKESSSQLDPLEEFTVLCQYLSLPPKLSLMVGCTQMRDLALSWTRHPRIQLLMATSEGKVKSPSEMPLKLIVQPHEVNRLVSLPADYSELINGVSQFICPNSDSDDSRQPTLCLVCGAMLCAQSYCCQNELDGNMVGACTYHTHKCGAGVGIFLKIRECKILLLAGRSKGKLFRNVSRF